LLDEFQVAAQVLRHTINSLSVSLDDFRAFLIEEPVFTLGAEQGDLLVPEILPMAIELAPALRAGDPENFRHAYVVLASDAGCEVRVHLKRSVIYR
jgi:hypothetical protein